MRFVIIDANNLVHRAKHVIKDHGNFDDAVGMVLTIVFHSMKKSYEKFGCEHAVVCFDSYSWRKDVYPEYKGDRDRKDDVKYKIIIQVLNDFRDFLKDCTNVTVLEREGIEADDFVARWTQVHNDPAFSHVIISADGDFKQLVREGVDLYDPIRYTLYTNGGVFYQDGKKIARGTPTMHKYDQVWKTKLDNQDNSVTFEPEWEIFFKCIRGRKNNMLTAWPNVWETKMRAAFETKGTDNPMKWNNFINSFWKAPDGESISVRDRYEKNLLLTDLRRQPQDIVDKMDDTINAALGKEHKHMVGAHFTKFCGKYNLPKLAQNPSVIVQILYAPYDI